MNLSTVSLFKQLRPDKCIVLDDVRLKALQNTLLEILKDVTAFCEKHGIRYTLGGGSALGAVRHGGFIPWDDDVDINMPRADYNRFIELFAAELGGQYWLHTPEHTPEYNLLLARVRKRGTSVVTREDFFNDECGAFVDIFVVENTPDNAVVRFLHGFGSMAFGFLHSCRKFYRERKPLMQLADGDASVTTVFRLKIAIGFFTSFLPMQTWTRLANAWNSACKNAASRYVSIPVGRKHYFGELYLRADVCRCRPTTFEGERVYLPENTHAYLSSLYGDYTAIPDEQNREKHIVFEPFIL